VLSNLSLPESVLWREKCPVYIYPDAKSYREASGQAEWSGGVSSVRSAGGRLVSQKVLTYQTAPKLLNSVLPHELAHLVFMSAIGYTKEFPLALHEGVAVYNELAFRRSYYRGVLGAHLKTETTIPLEKLFELKKYPAKPDLFYAQGLSVVQYLVAARGTPAFYKFSLDVGKQGLEPALKKNYGFRDLAEMERMWKTFARTKAK
jgi:hypothetical protein